MKWEIKDIHSVLEIILMWGRPKDLHSYRYLSIFILFYRDSFKKPRLTQDIDHHQLGYSLPLSLTLPLAVSVTWPIAWRFTNSQHNIFLYGGFTTRLRRVVYRVCVLRLMYAQNSRSSNNVAAAAVWVCVCCTKSYQWMRITCTCLRCSMLQAWYGRRLQGICRRDINGARCSRWRWRDAQSTHTITRTHSCYTERRMIQMEAVASCVKFNCLNWTTYSNELIHLSELCVHLAQFAIRTSSDERGARNANSNWTGKIENK